jgi:WD40 repeat protein
MRTCLAVFLVVTTAHLGAGQYSPLEPKERISLKGHFSGVYCVAFSPDNNMLATGGERPDREGDFRHPKSGEIIIWDMAKGEERAILERHFGGVNSLAFSPDGKLLASSSTAALILKDGTYAPDDTIILWDVKSGKERHVLHGHSAAVSSVAFSPDGKMLASSAYNKTIKIWEVLTGRERPTFDAQSEAVFAVAFSPDGKALASGCSDATIRLWEVSTGKVRAKLKGKDFGANSVAFSPDGKSLASGSTIMLWDAFAVREPKPFMGNGIRAITFAFF